jgi:hypothetical protein
MVLFDFEGKTALYANWLWKDGGIMTERNYYYHYDKKHIRVLQSTAPGVPAIIEYHSLHFNIKNKVDARLRELKELPEEIGGAAAAEKQVQVCYFEAYIKPDPAAEDFFNLYKLKDGRDLPREVKAEYNLNATVLNGIRDLIADRISCRKSGNKTGRLENGLFTSILNDLKSLSRIEVDSKPKYPHTIPVSARNLRPLLKRYSEYGYSILIHGNYDNINPEKLNDESKEWLVARWSAQVPTRVTLFELYIEYNERAKQKGWEALASEGTIRNYLFKPSVKSKWYGARYGELAAKEKYNRQHETILPEYRDALWYGDGTKLNYYYLNENGERATTCVYEVMDVYSECLLGYHISDKEDFEAQYRSYKSAMHFSGQKPYEIRFDNQGGHKKLQSGEFFKKLSHLAIATAPYNGRSKTIESAFGRLQTQFLHKEWYFTGQNITAKKQESRANMEFILANSKNLPTLDEVKKMYAIRRNEWNNTPHPETGIPRIEMYKNSINPKCRKIELADMIFMFGVRTQKPVTYRSNGISIEVKGAKYRYEVLDHEGNPDFHFLRLNVDREFIVEYDPEDMTAVSLFTPAKGKDDVCFVAIANKYITVHRDKQSQDEFDHHFIKAMEIMNKKQRVEMQTTTEELLEKYGYHPAQHGLNMPAIKGLNRKKQEDIGVEMKRVSNLVTEDIYDRY